MCLLCSYNVTFSVLFLFCFFFLTCVRWLGVTQRWWRKGENESHELMLAIAVKAAEAEHPVARHQSPCQSAMLSNT